MTYLRTEQPDILMLQEAYLGHDETLPEYLRTVSRLQELCGLPYSESEAQHRIRDKDAETPMGNAILSRFPLVNKQVTWLQGTAATLVEPDKRELIPAFPRNVLQAQVSVEGNSYNLLVTQGVWAASGEETERQKQAGKKLAGFIQGKENVILTGDFNVVEGSETIGLLEQNLTNIFKGQRISSFNMKHKTEPGFANAVVDFVFISPTITVLDHYTPDVNISDHQSQVVVFEL